MIIHDFQRHPEPEICAGNLFRAIEDPVFPLDIEEIAKSVGIQEIQEFDDEKLEGALVATSDKTAGFISVGTFIREATRRRFTIAHELGHFLIPTHKNVQKCTSGDMDRFSDRGDKAMEGQANIFAANLLMPRECFIEEINRCDPSNDLIRRLTDKFGSSLTSTLLRYVKLSDESLAVVMSGKAEIEWAFRSSNFSYFIPSKVLLSDGTMAMDSFEGKTVPTEFEEIEPDLWIDPSGIHHKVRLQELSYPLTYYDKVLSLLWLEEDEDETDEHSIEFDGYLKIKE